MPIAQAHIPRLSMSRTECVFRIPGDYRNINLKLNNISHYSTPSASLRLCNIGTDLFRGKMGIFSRFLQRENISLYYCLLGQNGNTGLIFQLENCSMCRGVMKSAHRVQFAHILNDLHHPLPPRHTVAQYHKMFSWPFDTYRISFIKTRGSYFLLFWICGLYY